MTERFTTAWIAGLDAAIGRRPVPPDLQLVIQQVVTHPAEPDVAYAIRLEGGRAAVVPGRAADADVTFTQDRSTADAIARGELSAQAAFLAGRLRVGGDLRSVIDRARGVIDLDDLFAAARALEA